MGVQGKRHGVTYKYGNRKVFMGEVKISLYFYIRGIRTVQSVLGGRGSEKKRGEFFFSGENFLLFLYTQIRNVRFVFGE